MFESSDASAIFLSLQVSVAAMIIAAPPSVALGVWLARSRTRFAAIVEALVIAPLVMPPVITGIALLMLVSWLRLPIAFSWWAAVLAAAIVSAPLLVRTVRSASRTVDPQKAVVLSVTGFRTDGMADNVIPEHAELVGTVRTFDREIQAQVETRMTEIVAGTAAAAGVRAALRYERNYPVTVNDPAKTDFAAAVAREGLALIKPAPVA